MKRSKERPLELISRSSDGPQRETLYVAVHKTVDASALKAHKAVMEPSKLVLEAIALRKCIEATYNRMAVKLAPHILYTRHGELFIDAVTVERDGRAPKELKLGTFKLAGLQIREIVSRSFNAATLFDPNQPKYAGVTLFAVESN